MSDKITALKEKFRLALTSTAKVIADDFDLANQQSEKEKASRQRLLLAASLHSRRGLGSLELKTNFLK